MSLSVAAIEKHQDALAKLIGTWVENNPGEPTSTVRSEPKPAAPEQADGPKQVVTVALRTRPFLDSEIVEGKKLLNGVHARGTKMFVHVPAAKVGDCQCVSRMTNNLCLVVWTDHSAQSLRRRLFLWARE